MQGFSIRVSGEECRVQGLVPVGGRDVEVLRRDELELGDAHAQGLPHAARVNRALF